MAENPFEMPTEVPPVTANTPPDTVVMHYRDHVGTTANHNDILSTEVQENGDKIYRMDVDTRRDADGNLVDQGTGAVSGADYQIIFDDHGRIETAIQEEAGKTPQSVTANFSTEEVKELAKKYDEITQANGGEVTAKGLAELQAMAAKDAAQYTDRTLSAGEVAYEHEADRTYGTGVHMAKTQDGSLIEKVDSTQLGSDQTKHTNLYNINVMIKGKMESLEFSDDGIVHASVSATDSKGYTTEFTDIAKNFSNDELQAIRDKYNAITGNHYGTVKETDIQDLGELVAKAGAGTNDITQEKGGRQ